MVNDGDEQPNPFTRPGFIAAAVVITVIVALGIVLAVRNATREDAPAIPGAAPSMSTGPAAVATATPPQSGVEPSVCGLPGEAMEGTLTTAPAAEWGFQNTTAYPTSAEFGPGETNSDGVRYCFQHSPAGAVFAAANAVVQGSDTSSSSAWINYFLSEHTPGRTTLIGGEPGETPSSTRVAIAGFRLLAYDGETARVDIVARATSSGQTVFASAVYNLVWEAGDWKLYPDDTSDPLPTAQIPDLVGYTVWGQ